MSTVLTQGWSGLAISYAAVQGPMLAGLARGRAKWHKFLLSPAIAAPLTVTVGVGMAMATPLMAGIGVAPPGVIPFAFAVSLSAAIGYAGGRAMSRGPSDGKTHQRGAMVAEQPRDASGHRQGNDTIRRNHIGETPRCGPRRDQALQADRHDGNGQKYRDPGNVEWRACARRSGGDCGSRRRLYAAIS